MSLPVVIIGAGLSGMTAAAAAAGAGAKVLMLGRSGVGLGTNSAISNGYITAPTFDYSAERYVADTVEIGCKLNHLPKVEQAAAQAPEAIAFARKLGAPLMEGPDFYQAGSKRPELIRGVPLVRTIARGLSTVAGVRAMTGCQVLNILTREGRAVGVDMLDQKGRRVVLEAGAVILAAGGAGAIYARHDNQRSTVGQAYALAVRAGLSLWDMEFVQFYPLVIDEPGLPALIIYPPYHEKARLLGPDGSDALVGLGDLNQAMLKKRDAMSTHLFKLERRGPLRLDMSGLPEEAWNHYPDAVLDRLHWDWRKKPARVGPGVHFFMGGVRTDPEGRTDLAGLLACGEVTWGLHGANRRGGNALLECLFTGMAAGRAAAHEAAGARPAPLGPPPPPPEPAPGPAPDARALRRRLGQVAWDRAGVVRDAAGIEAGLRELVELEQAGAALPAGNAKELRAREDFACATLVLRAVLTASRRRVESRGAFTRDDHPDRDDALWLANSRLRQTPEGGFDWALERPA